MNGDEHEAHELCPSQLEKEVLAAAAQLKDARRRGRTPNRILLIDTLSGLFEKLARGRRLFTINKVAKSFSGMAIDQVPPRPEQVLACWELAYQEETDLNALEELAEAKTNGQEMQQKADAWRTARENAEKSARSVGAASLDDPKGLIALTNVAQSMAKRQAKALGELLDLISPGNKPFELEHDYVGDLATDQPKAESDSRLRGLKPNGPKIRKLRASKKWSQKEFIEEIKAATGIYLSTRTIARAENPQANRGPKGELRSDRRTLEAIARTLDLELREIVVD